MDTVESRTEEQPAAEAVYDGFISYSHAADDLLAPRLQAGLQRFAKPWWKRRALRIFRDESSLSANPHLWSSITDALDESDWFVLLLSPEAAESPWVNNEVEYWLANKDPDRIIPVLTDGDFGWAEGDVAGDTAPPALAGAFSDEPRWVDLKFARTEEQLDLKNPRFSAAIADVASAIRGVPKDELESEEVRQHRRTSRTAWGAGVGLFVLALLAGATALYALDQRSEAVANSSRADQNAAEAEANAEDERQAREEADENGLIAKSRELAAASVSAIDEDPELSMLLAMESIDQLPHAADVSPVGVLALRDAMTANRLLSRFPVTEGGTWAELSPDGSVAYYSSEEDRSVTAVAVADGSELWSYHDPTTVDQFQNISLSAERSLLAVSINDVPTVEDEAVELDESGNDAHPARVVVLDTSTGEVVTILTPGECIRAMTWRNGFSPNGEWLAVYTGDEGCVTDPAADWVAVYDTSSWEVKYRLQVEGFSDEGVTFSADSSRILLHPFAEEPELRSFPDLELINTLPATFWATLSPDGQQVALRPVSSADVDLRPQLLNADTGQLIARLDAVDDFLNSTGLAYSSDGSMIGVVTRADSFVFRTDNGRLLAGLGEGQVALSLSFTSDGSRVLTGTVDGLLLWDISGGETDAGVPVELPGDRSGWFNPDTVVDGPSLAATALAWHGTGELIDIVTVVLDRETGSRISEIPGEGAQLPDGRFVIAQNSLGVEDRLIGPIVVWDPSTGSTQVIDDCITPESQLEPGGEVDCEGPVFADVQDWDNVNPIVVSVNGSFFAAQAHARGAERQVRVWDVETLEIRSEFSISQLQVVVAAGPTWLVIYDIPSGALLIHDVETGTIVGEPQHPHPFNIPGNVVVPDGSTLISADLDGRIVAFDASTWETVVSWQAHDARLRGIAISPDGALLATTGEDNVVKIWDIGALTGDSPSSARPLLLDRIPAPRPSDAAWLDIETLAVFPAAGARFMVVPLSIDDLVSTAQARLTRGFTTGECATYLIDPCPTLDEIRSR